MAGYVISVCTILMGVAMLLDTRQKNKESEELKQQIKYLVTENDSLKEGRQDAARRVLEPVAKTPLNVIRGRTFVAPNQPGPVRLRIIAVNSNGSVIKTFAVTTSDANGRFEHEINLGPDGIKPTHVALPLGTPGIVSPKNIVIGEEFTYP